MNVRYNEQTKSIEIDLSVFLDDIEKTINDENDMSLDFLQEENQKKVVSLLGIYFKKHISMSINGSPLNYIFLGAEFDEGKMECFFEANNASGIASIVITNTIMMKQFKDQFNLVNIHSLGQVKSIKLEDNNNSGIISFK